MPVAIKSAPYDDRFMASAPGPASAAATPAAIFTANKTTGFINLSSTISIANASDAEFCSSSISGMVGQLFDIPQNPANPVIITARFTPCTGTHTRTVTDEFGVSALSLRVTMSAICYVFTPNIGWIRPHSRIRSFSDTIATTHTGGAPGPVPARGSWASNWTVPTPAGGFPNGLFCWVGLWVTENVTCDDVTVTTTTTIKGTVQQIQVGF